MKIIKMMSMTMIVLRKVFKERTMVQNKFRRYSNVKIKKEGAFDGPPLKIICTQTR